MKKIVKEALPIERFTKTREDAIAYFKEKDEPYKVELIEDLPEDETISFYSQGEFTDLCAGPHLMSTKYVKAFKLTSLAGAYWRGSEKNKMLQRIYGTAFPKKAELEEYLNMLEEAKKRDHRKLGMDWDFSRLGVYPMEKRGLTGILTHPLIHSGFSHLLANTIPLFFLSWCLFYFYRGIAGKIFILIWLGSGLLTFLIGKPGWHIGASGLIYGFAFFLFFSGILRKYVPLIAISLLVTFLYGGIIWHMFPYFSPTNMSWEGHLSGGIMGTLCAFVFVNHGPQRPEPFADEMEEENNEEEKGKSP